MDHANPVVILLVMTNIMMNYRKKFMMLMAWLWKMTNKNIHEDTQSGVAQIWPISNSLNIIIVVMIISFVFFFFKENGLPHEVENASLEQYYPLQERTLIYQYPNGQEISKLFLPTDKNNIFYMISDGERLTLCKENKSLYLIRAESTFHNEKKLWECYPPKPILVAPLTVGQTWHWETKIIMCNDSEHAPKSVISEKGYATVVRIEIVNTIAGKFKCLKVREKNLQTYSQFGANFKSNSKLDLWYAENIGLVKERRFVNDGICGTMHSFELKKISDK